MTVASLFSIFGCGTTTPLETGTFEGQPYQFSSTEYKGFSTNSIEERIKLGSLPAIDINAQTTDWGPPYADDVYGSAPFVYTAAHRLPYSLDEQDTVNPTNTMLYLSPKRFSKAAFDQYARFMKREWPKLDAKYATQPGLRSFPHLIGLVYGSHDDFERVFTGKEEGEKRTLTVHIDGRVVLENGVGIFYSGLSSNIQMPGKILYLDTDSNGASGALTLPKLQTYRDTKGKTITDYFTVVPKATDR